MQNKEILLTILTPTYNRGELLKKCYCSLKEQSRGDFQWLIIDDGSSDNTGEIVKQFISDTPDMDITYVKKKNGGKHTALNTSHSYIKGKYVLILDSDDTLTDDAVESVCSIWKKYDDNESIGIVTFLKGEAVNKPNAYVKDEYVPVDIMRYKRVCVKSNDCCEVIRTGLFLKYPFPVFEGEKFVSEGALWNRVSMTHKCIYINKVIYLCEYLEDGLTKSGRSMRIKNPYGGMYTSNLRMNKKNFLKERIKSGLLYICYGHFAGMNNRQIIIYDKNNRMLKAVCLLPGYIMYRRWKKRY